MAEGTPCQTPPDAPQLSGKIPKAARQRRTVQWSKRPTDGAADIEKIVAEEKEKNASIELSYTGAESVTLNIKQNAVAVDFNIGTGKTNFI